MIDSTPTPHARSRRVTIAEAARLLGVSGETIRRRIHAGQIEAIREVRPQGSAWRVLLPVTDRVVSTRGGHTPPHVVSDQEKTQATDTTVVEATPVVSDVVSSTALVASIARLIAELAEVRVISDRRADELVSRSDQLAAQAETIGQLRAELAHVTAPQTLPARQPEPEPPAASVSPSAPGPALSELSQDAAPWWRVIAASWSWLVLLGILVLAFVVGQAGGEIRP